MADNNLTVQIGGDSSKLRRELALTQAALRATNREIKALTDTAQKLGAPGQAAIAAPLDEAIGKGAALERQIKSLNKSIRGTTDSVDDFHKAAHPRKFYLVEQSLQNLNGAFMAIGHNIGGAQAAIAGFAVGIGLQKIGELITSTADSLNKLNQTSSNIGVPAANIKAFQDVMAKSAVSSDAAAGSLTTFSKAAFDAQLKAGAFNKTQTFGIDTMKGTERSMNELSVNIGEKITDLSNSFELLRINVLRFPTTPAGLDKLTLATAKALQNTKLLNAQLRSQIGQQMFGPDWEAITAGLVKYANSPEWEHAQKQAEKLFSPEAKANLDAYNAAIGELRTSTEGAFQELTLKYFPQINAAIKATPGVVQQILTEVEQTAQTTKREVQALIDLAKTAGPIVKNALSTHLDDVGETFTNIPPAVAEIKTFTADIPPAVAEIKKPFSTLPKFFEGITVAIGDSWKKLFSNIKLGAQATAASVAQSENQMGVMVGRGPGTGDQGGYGPGSRPTQSILPGVSDYQAPPPKGVMVTAERGREWSQTAAEASADAAYAARSAAEASALATKAWVDPGAESRFASGGLVHGPGTATSDSIVARLSRGEFVMRAAAVNRVGASFLSRLNGFADGGMVMPSRSIPSFAGGGLVSGGGGGATVNLVFPGGSFELRADSETVGALTREARRAGMLSAGRLAGAIA